MVRKPQHWYRCFSGFLAPSNLGPLTSWGNFLRRRERVNQLLYAEIWESREQPDPSRTDILSLMVVKGERAVKSRSLEAISG